MRIERCLRLLLLLPILAVGCTTVTNLTPSKLERSANGFYPFEVAWESRQQSLKRESVVPQILIGTEAYEMKAVPIVSNRWETLVPIPADKQSVTYRIKFNWNSSGMSETKKETLLTKEYQLEIINKR